MRQAAAGLRCRSGWWSWFPSQCRTSLTAPAVDIMSFNGRSDTARDSSFVASAINAFYADLCVVFHPFCLPRSRDQQSPEESLKESLHLQCRLNTDLLELPMMDLLYQCKWLPCCCGAPIAVLPEPCDRIMVHTWPMACEARSHGCFKMNM